MPLTLTYQTSSQDHNKSLGNFLKEQGLSRKTMVALKHRGGKIAVNDQAQTTRCLLDSSDEITVVFPDEPISQSLFPVEMAINIVYEDDFILVINKKEGFPVIATGSHSIALANGILAHYEKMGLRSTVHFVNRLDKDTSGLMAVAKYRHIHCLMTKGTKAVTRKYYAQVAGILKGDGCINMPIYRPSATNVKRVVHPSGQQAITYYEVVQPFKSSTLVRCILETGRTHQIRVHMAHIGYPILKDALYGDGMVGERQLLHSYFLAFIHPMTGEYLCFETGIPSRFKIDHES